MFNKLFLLSSALFLFSSFTSAQEYGINEHGFEQDNSDLPSWEEVDSYDTPVEQEASPDYEVIEDPSNYETTQDSSSDYGTNQDSSSDNEPIQESSGRREISLLHYSGGDDPAEREEYERNRPATSSNAGPGAPAPNWD